MVGILVGVDKALGGLFFVFLAIGLLNWIGMARLARGQTLSVKQKEYVEAARASGASNLRIIFRHILPNIIGPCVVAETLAIPGYILTEALSPDEEPKPSQYRPTYLALARGEFPKDRHGYRAKKDQYLELYGILPTLTLLRQRFTEVNALECAADLDLETLRAFDGETEVDSVTKSAGQAGTGNAKSTEFFVSGESISAAVVEVSDGAVGYGVDFVSFTRPCEGDACGSQVRVLQESAPGAGDFEDNELGFLLVFPARSIGKDAPRLGHGFNNQDAWHHRRSWEVSLEKRLIHGHILEADDTFMGYHFHNSIN